MLNYFITIFVGDDGGLWQPSDRSVVCSLHFTENDFKECSSKRILKSGVTPSVFPCYPSYKQVKNVSCRTKRVREGAPENHRKKKKDLPAQLNLENNVDTSDITPEVSNSSRKSVHIQTDPSSYCVLKRRQIQSLKRINRRLKCKIKELATKAKILERRCIDSENKIKSLNIRELEDAANEGDVKASFFIEQLHAFGQKSHRWSESTIRYCVLWRSKSQSAYDFGRNALLTLPSRSTLKRYIGTCTKDNIKGLISQRLAEQRSLLGEEETLGSLIIDDMSIKPDVEYVRCSDTIVGTVDMDGLEKNNGRENVIATHLTCFVFQGLSTHFAIPVHYYFTNNLTGIELKELTLNVISEVESAGFFVIRIVTDNHATNVKMFSEMCGGHPKPQIEHPLDSSRPLFLSYDYCHIIKNVRNLFLKKSFLNNGSAISPKYLRMLYSIQKNEVWKPVRFLTEKHLNPSNFEKMNVKRAVQIFSEDVTASLITLKDHGPAFGITGFEDCEATVQFLEIMRTWFNIHNVRNTTYHIHSRDETCKHFFEVDDSRLYWLENDFPNYLDLWKNTCTNPKTQFLSKETYDAITLTTVSTAQCIKYLLLSGFHFVLTRKFSSDQIEILFSSIRRMGGSNDQTNAVVAVQAIHKILTKGMISASLNANAVDNSTGIQNMLSRDVAPQSTSTTISQNENNNNNSTLIEVLSPTLEDLENGTNNIESTLTTATLAVIASYLIRTVKDNLNCENCKQLFVSKDVGIPALSLLKNLNRGGYFYPTLQFLKIVCAFDSAAKIALPYMYKDKNPLKKIKDILHPVLIRNPTVKCDSPTNDGNHESKLCDLLLNKFLRPYISNFCRRMSEEARCKKTALYSKPLSRKVHKI